MSNPIAIVQRHPDYWSRGHFHDGRSHVLKPIADLDKLSVGTELYLKPPALEPVAGDLMPAIGSEVLIHLAREDEWVRHTVVGFFAAPDHDGDWALVRLFVRVRHPGGSLNARLLSEVRSLDGKPLYQPKTPTAFGGRRLVALSDSEIQAVIDWRNQAQNRANATGAGTYGDGFRAQELRKLLMQETAAAPVFNVVEDGHAGIQVWPHSSRDAAEGFLHQRLSLLLNNGHAPDFKLTPDQAIEQLRSASMDGEGQINLGVSIALWISEGVIDTGRPSRPSKPSGDRDYLDAASAPAADPCPGCMPGTVCRTPACGRLKLPREARP